MSKQAEDCKITRHHVGKEPTPIPDYWPCCPHPSVYPMPAHFTSANPQHRDARTWKNAVQQLTTRGVSTDEKSSLWLKLAEWVLGKATPYRKNYYMKLYVSDTAVLFMFRKRPDWLAELKTYWTPDEIAEWEKTTQFILKMFGDNDRPLDAFLETAAADHPARKLLAKVMYLAPVTAKDIPTEVEKFHKGAMAGLATLAGGNPETLMLRFAAECHAAWTRIMPFSTGNGRIIRLWLGAVFMHFGFLPLPCTPQPDYFKAIRTGTLLSFFGQQYRGVQLLYTVTPLSLKEQETFVASLVGGSAQTWFKQLTVYGLERAMHLPITASQWMWIAEASYAEKRPDLLFLILRKKGKQIFQQSQNANLKAFVSTTLEPLLP